MLIAKHSFFKLGQLGIPTAEWEEFYDEEQLKPGSEYQIGVLKNPNDTELVDEKAIRSTDDQVRYVQELKRRHGSKVTIILKEIPIYKETGLLTIKDSDCEVAGSLDEDEMLALSHWSRILSKDYMFKEGKGMVVLWGKDQEGQLMVRNIFQD